MTPPARKRVGTGGSGRPSQRAPEPLRQVDQDFENEYPGASALATECFANLFLTGELLMELHNHQSRAQYGLSPSGRQVLAVVEGARQPLEPSVIAERVLITSGSMTSILDTLERRGLVQRLPHPDDRRKLLVNITPDAQTILDELLPSLHAREHDVISNALTTREQELSQLRKLFDKPENWLLPEQNSVKPSEPAPSEPPQPVVATANRTDTSDDALKL